MITGSENLAALVASENFQLPTSGDENPTVGAVRSRGLVDFLAVGFDLRGREEWKYSDTNLFSHGRFVPFGSSSASGSPINLPETDDLRLVFINGVFSSENSRISGLKAGIDLQPLAGATAAGLGQLAVTKDAPLVALNTIFWTDGLKLELADGVSLEKPIHLHFLTDGKATGKLVTPRNLIRAGRGSKATIIEHFEATAEDELLHAPVTEIFCGADSDIVHLKIISESTKALHLGSTHVRQAEGSRYTSREFAMSGALVRRELHLDLVGQGATCDLTALSMAGSKERRDMRTRVGHLVSGCETFELYKGLFDDNASGVFDGKILVARDAQQTNAHQTNRNLLLSDDAVSYSIPRLEIYADDVKCSHGSTTGQLDDEQIFFLRSRGFDAQSARVMLARAFANEILEGVKQTDLRVRLDAEITARLASSEGGQSA
jgi:Fe-S cluster assembly protein SufD